MREIGETRRLSPRDDFEFEATEFTRWLSSNLVTLLTALLISLRRGLWGICLILQITCSARRRSGRCRDEHRSTFWVVEPQ